MSYAGFQGTDYTFRSPTHLNRANLLAYVEVPKHTVVSCTEVVGDNVAVEIGGDDQVGVCVSGVLANAGDLFGMGVVAETRLEFVYADVSYL